MEFIPYTPPNEGEDLQFTDRDLCWRINPRGLVTPAVIARCVGHSTTSRRQTLSAQPFSPAWVWSSITWLLDARNCAPRIPTVKSHSRE